MCSYIENDERIKCAIASEAVYSNDPALYIQQNFSYSLHGFEGISASTETFEAKYMICSCKTDKKLVIAFRGDKITDILDSLLTDPPLENSETGGFVEGLFYKKSLLIPTDFFNKKLLDGYKLLFTGHSSGSVVAAFVALKLLLKSKNHQPNVCFIGFGCPVFGDETFAQLINSNFPDNFEFFINENDFLPRMLSSFEYLWTVSAIELNPFDHFDEETLFIFNKIRSIFMKQTNQDKLHIYKSFGVNSHVTGSSIETFKVNQRVKLQFDDMYWEDFKESVCDHDIVNYRLNLFRIYQIYQDFSPEITNLKELTEIFLPDHLKPEAYKLECYPIGHSEVYLFVEIQNCPNMEFLHDARVVIRDSCHFPHGKLVEVFKKPTKLNRKIPTYSLIFKIGISSDMSLNPTELSEIYLCSHFNTVMISFENRIFSENSYLLSYKQLQLYDMDVDFLYLQALSYFVLKQEMISNGKENLTSEIKEDCDQIHSIFKNISIIFDTDRDELNQVLMDVNVRNDIIIRFSEYYKNELGDVDLEACFSDMEFLDLDEEIKNRRNYGAFELICRLYPSFYLISRKLSLLDSIDVQIYDKLVKICDQEDTPRTYKASLSLLIKLINRINKNDSLVPEKVLYKLEKQIEENRHQIYKKLRCKSEAEFFGTEWTDNEMDLSVLSSKKFEYLDSRILNIISYNYKLRDCLVDDFVIGVVGNRNHQKTKFIEGIAGARKIIMPNDLSTKICDNIIMFDYSQFENRDLELLLSKIVLDYGFILVSSENEYESESTKLLIETVVKEFDGNFSVIFYKSGDEKNDDAVVFNFRTLYAANEALEFNSESFNTINHNKDGILFSIKDKCIEIESKNYNNNEMMQQSVIKQLKRNFISSDGKKREIMIEPVSPRKMKILPSIAEDIVDVDIYNDSSEFNDDDVFEFFPSLKI